MLPAHARRALGVDVLADDGECRPDALLAASRRRLLDRELLLDAPAHGFGERDPETMGPRPEPLVLALAELESFRNTSRSSPRPR